MKKKRMNPSLTLAVSILEYIIPVTFSFSSISFTRLNVQHRYPVQIPMSTDEVEDQRLDPAISSQFTIKICSSTSCAKSVKAMGMDEYHILSGMYARKEGGGATLVEVEETSCLGCCNFAPCIGIEHEDYIGTVSLDGMNANEFSDGV